MNDIASALAAGTPAERTFDGTVLDAPREFYGRGSGAWHEYFHVAVDGVRVEVAENLGEAPFVPVQVGDAVELHGEFVPHGSHGPLMHWLHHASGGGHEGGWILDGGRRFA